MILEGGAILMKLNQLDTEKVNQNSLHIDEMSTIDILKAGKRAVRRVRFERPYGAAGRRLLPCAVFHHHPAHHRTGKRDGGAFPLPDPLRVDGGLLGAALCAAQRFHLSFPPCHLPCVSQYPHTAAG